MCLILFSYDIHPKYSLIFAGNRDEFYDRPTKHLSYWDEKKNILAGRDLKGNGTWLGITQNGRFCTITNYRDIINYPQQNDAPTRGKLVSRFLEGGKTPINYLQDVKSTGHKYNGFNLITGDRTGFYYYSNIKNCIQKLKPGLYGMSNHLLNTPWPKVEKAKGDFERIVTESNKIDPEDIFSILKDTSRPPDSELPDTGVGIEWERILSSIFISSKTYGTRSTSVILVERNGKITFIEKSFIPKGKNVIEDKISNHSFY